MAEQFEDETFAERVAALQEMFPEPVRKMVSSAASTTAWTVSNAYTYGGKLLWILASSALVLGLIPQYESDQEQMQAQQAESIRMQHQQMLTGGAPSSQMGAVPGMAPAPQRS
ncbi:hypothetical protein PTSG_10127 [Salpingoeca rosetta]|uniref:Mitochondrial import receptor subunit tom22 n=1 Tax=Salpingoeca rosetta (strain ATCC 50818 / BSB-021) TaxID=946362 RepID=F2UQD6_SALR5|nr:uncharacterized protein PTSG_10127 [Salpingoeca rosetta]EGD79841.1 hypothetical protein PTSG_10127 [Salpingoeca rosetta]|eukprot:XP_004988462.1 hypothetical protein PTSG_10127 [Salpingoeca rosetta]